MKKKCMLGVLIAYLVNVLYASEVDVSMRLAMFNIDVYKIWGKNHYEEYGLDYCIGYSKSSAVDNKWKIWYIQDRDNMLKKHCGKQALDDLKNYVDNNIEDRMLGYCLSFYNSPKYKAEVEHLFAKHCKVYD